MMVEFNKWLAEYGLEDDALNDLNKTVILTFTEDDQGKIRASYKGAAVFRHRDFEKTIMPGETWICSISKKNTYYFAKAVKRIDSSFIFELKKEQMDEIAARIWEDHKEIIEPLLSEKYKEITNDKINAAIEDTRSSLETELKTLNDTIRELEQKDAENKNIIASLHDQLNAAKREQKYESEKAGPVGMPTFIGLPSTTVSVRRIGPDSIFSESFDRSRYYVHLSADSRIVVVRPHPEGDAVCINNTIVLWGLSKISTYNEPYDMISEYSHVYGGVQIYL